MAAGIEKTAMESRTVAGAGFADPVHDAQAVFRAVLAAMSRPGVAQALHPRLEPPAPLSPAMTALALTLLDQDVSLWLSPTLEVPAVRTYLAFHTGARRTDKSQSATFVLCKSPAEIPPIEFLAQGTPDYPDRSATVIVDVSQAPEMRVGAILSGPGIEHPIECALPGFGRTLWRQLQANHAAYPLGVDLIVCTAQGVLGLPRSTKIEVA